MANISITRRCRRQCDYCFAKHELSSSTLLDMNPEVFERALSFLKLSLVPEARLLGGEPILHPLFRIYVARAMEEGLRVVVFSGGDVPHRLMDEIEGLATEDFCLVLNAADPAAHPAELVHRQQRMCQALGSRVRLGVNVLGFDQDGGYLLDWIERYRLQRTIRVGVAHPIWGGGNAFLQLKRRRQLPMVEQLFESAQHAGVETVLDCGFTPCMFSDAFVEAHPGAFQAEKPAQDLGADGTGAGAPLRPKGGLCGPAIDILPEGVCIGCYALSRVARFPLLETDCRDDLVRRFEQKLTVFVPSGMYRECEGCAYRERSMCDGGCRARRALRFRPARMPVPVAGPEETNRS